MPLQKWSEHIWLSQPSDGHAFSDEMDVLLSQYSAAELSPHMVVDLSGMTRLNSTHIAQLLRLRKLVVDRERKMRIAGPNNAVWTVFLTAGLDQVFEFSTDTTVALAELQLGGA